MPRKAITLVYQFSELSDAAKEKARDWWRGCESQEFGDLYEYDDFSTIAKILGIDFKQIEVKTIGGSVRHKPAIYWSGFSSQGDGACFEGSYSYAKGCAKAIREHAGQDTELHSIADALVALQKSWGYRLTATVKHSGNYYHEYSTDIDVSDGNDDSERPIIEADEQLTELLRRFMKWMYRQLEAEYYYRMSDEYVDESIDANAYEFTEEGRIHRIG